MRFPRDDDHDIRTLIERGSSSWVGPSPSAHQARWADEERPRRWVSLGRAAAGFCVAALLTGSLALVATSRSPNDAAESVIRLVSHVFTTPPGTQPTVSPESPPPGSPAAPAGAPSSTPTAGSRTPRPPSPTPRRSQPPDDYRSSPAPSPTGRTATPSPSPSPSRTPDE